MTTVAPAAPSETSPPASCGDVVNVMTVDVEDYFHASAFEPVVSRNRWGEYESRVCANTDRLLDVLAEGEVRGTFFVLGWVAEKFPALVRRIAGAGHHLASHSYWHRLVYDLQPAEFREDVRRARAAIEDASGTPVRGFRAASFSITARSLWALDLLAEEGYEYDASVFPIRHDRYGIPAAPTAPFRLAGPNGDLVEVPATAVAVGGFKLPVGGGYFRLLPYAATRWAIRRLNATERQRAVFYVHPWELDPGQPRLPGSVMSRARHYNQLGRTHGRLTRLLKEFRFGSIESTILPEAASFPRTESSDAVVRGLQPARPVP